MKTRITLSGLKRTASILGILAVISTLVSAVVMYALRRQVIKIENGTDSTSEINRLSNQVEDLGHRLQILEMDAQATSAPTNFYATQAAISALHDAINTQILAKYTRVDQNVVRISLPKDYALKSFDIPRSIWNSHTGRTMKWSEAVEGNSQPSEWTLTLDNPIGFQIRVRKLSYENPAVNQPFRLAPCDASLYTSPTPNAFLTYLTQEKGDDVNTYCSKIIKSSRPLRSIFHDAESKTYFAYTYTDPTTSSIAIIAGLPTAHYGFLVEFLPDTDSATAAPNDISTVKKEMRAAADLFLTSATHAICQNDYMGCY